MEIKDRRILIVDDEIEICELLSRALKREGFTNIYTSNSGEDGIQMALEKEPHLIVLDIMMGELDGYDVCSEIRRTSKVPILFLSARNEEMDRILGFALGGDDYVTKPFSPKEMCYRIKAQLRRSYPQEEVEETLEVGPFSVNIKGLEVKKNGELLQLKPKELMMLIYFIKNKERILTKEQICSHVWGEEYVGFDNTIMVHIRRLREKIEDDPSSPRFLINKKGLGYKFTIPGE